jgi:hypothetical protein
MRWWQRLFRRRKQEEELEKELRLDLDQHTADLIAQGLDPEEARRQARPELGGPEQVKEQRRDARGTRWLMDLAQDLRYGLRMMCKHKGFTLFAVCGLALAIGTNTFVFTIVNAALFSNMSFPGSDRLAYLSSFDTAHGEAEPLEVFSYAEYRDLKERMRSFDDLAAVQYGRATMSDDANFPEGYFIARVTANTLSVLGQKPLIGRDLDPADTQPGAAPVALLSYGVWERRYLRGKRN